MKSMNLSTSLNATVINSSLNYFFTVKHQLIREVIELSLLFINRQCLDTYCLENHFQFNGGLELQ